MKQIARNSKTTQHSTKNYLREITRKYKDKRVSQTSKGSSSKGSSLNNGIINFPEECTYNPIENSLLSSKKVTLNSLRNNNEKYDEKQIGNNNIIKQLSNTEEEVRKFEEYKISLEKKIQSLRDTLLKKKLQKENQIKSLSYEKFKSINRINIKLNPFIIFLQMLDTQDIYFLMIINKEIRQMIIDALSFEIKTFIANKFESLSNSIFSNYIFTLEFMSYLIDDTPHTYLSLIIKNQIISSKLISKSVHMRYSANFPCDGNEQILNHFLFDIKNSPLHFWIIKEYTFFHQDDLNKAYLQRVMQYKLNDFAEFTINIITDKGLMNIRNFNWLNIKVFPTPKEDFYEFSKENSKNREIIDFDVNRICELEVLKCEWSDIHLMEHSKEVLESIEQIFIEKFRIEKILYDDVGYYIFKVYLIAVKEGKISSQNDMLGITITVMKEKDSVSNEAKKNNLIYDRKNEIQIHIGDTLVFYLTRSKE